MKPRLKIAELYATQDAGMQVGKESFFSRSLERLVTDLSPATVIETGTYHGTGTTAAVCRALAALEQRHCRFYSIEINPQHYGTALKNLQQNGMLPYVHVLNGLSLPRGLLLSKEDIRKTFVEEYPHDNVFVDHKENVKVERYFQETARDDAPDDLLDLCLQSCGYRPDLLILDSAGHLGFIEFMYVVSKIQGKCFFALDDTSHVKHRDSLIFIQNNTGFRIMELSEEKFGFCIAEFTPAHAASSQNICGLTPSYADSQHPSPLDDHPFLSKFQYPRNSDADISIHTSQVKRLLYFRMDSIGDAVLAAPMPAALKKAYPEAKIIAVCDETCRDIHTRNPFIAEVITLDKCKIKEEDYFRLAVKALRAVRADMTANFTYSNTPETFALSLLTDAPLLAVENDCANMPQHHKLFFEKTAAMLFSFSGKVCSEADRYRELLGMFGQSPDDYAPLLHLSEADRRAAGELWKKTGFIPEKTIALFASGQSSIRDYALFGEALAPVCKRHNLSVAALGAGERERAVNAQCVGVLQDRTIAAVNLSGECALPTSAALLASCRLAVGVETGLAHMACALGVPQVILLGGGHFGRFMPFSPHTTAACLPLECYGCNWKCRYSTPHCITGIKPEVICEAVEFTLTQPVVKGSYGRLFIQKPTSWPRKSGMPKWKSPQGFIRYCRDRSQTSTALEEVISR